MTNEQATAAATANNEIINEYTRTIIYQVFAYWSIQFEKQYNIVLIPAKYKIQFGSADYSEALAFARVSRKTNVLSYTTADTWVSNFDNEAAADPELNKYLNDK
jgi:hypothetical protein